MGSMTKFSYQRLKNECGFDEDPEEEKAFRRMRNWSKIRKLAGKKQRPRIRIAGLKKFFRRRKYKIFSAVRVTWRKALKRLKESQAHMNDLFAGNYLFTQVSPSHKKYMDKTFMGHDDLHGLTSRYSYPKFP